MFDYGKLMTQIKIKVGTIKVLSEKTNISYSSLIMKLNNRCDFTQSDMNKIKEVLGLENYSTYFFDEVK